jgi:antitoxin component of RelBE/YafQ-DinJ toxin-antitoxin module
MKKSIAFALAMTAVPAQAAGLGDLAKVVLGNGAVLQKSNDTCQQTTGSKTTLGMSEILALSIARQAAQNALPADQFLSLDTAASANAVKAAQAPKFCDQTAKKKNVLLDAVKKAGQKLVTARVLGL